MKFNPLNMTENQRVIFNILFIIFVAFAMGWGSAMMWDYYTVEIDCFQVSKEIESNVFEFIIRCEDI